MLHLSPRLLLPHLGTSSSSAGRASAVSSPLLNAGDARGGADPAWVHKMAREKDYRCRRVDANKPVFIALKRRLRGPEKTPLPRRLACLATAARRPATATKKATP
jgi:hypothetical protein